MRLDEMGKRWHKKGSGEKWTMKETEKLQRVFFKCSLNQIQPRTTTQKSIINHSKGKSGEDGVGSVFLSRSPEQHSMTLNCVKVMENRRPEEDNLSDGI